MADEQNFLDSPWAQIGVPLAATIATAVAPRHAGRAAAIGLGAFNTMSDQRMQQKRLSAVLGEQDRKQQLEQQRLADSDLLFDTYTKADDTPPDATAPEGGNAPQVDMTAKNEAMDKGKVPKPTFALPATRAQMYKKLSRVIGPDKVGEMFVQDVANYSKMHPEFDPKEVAAKVLAVTGLDIPVGGKVNDIPLPGGGSYDFAPPAPDKPPTPTPYLDARAGVSPDQLPAFAEKWQQREHASVTPTYTPFTDPNTNNQFGYNNRTNTFEPSRGLPPRLSVVVPGEGTSTPVGASGQPPQPAQPYGGPNDLSGTHAPLAQPRGPSQPPQLPPDPLVKTGARPYASNTQVMEIAQGIKSGKLPPDYATKMGRNDAARVAAYSMKLGTDISKLQLEYESVKRHILSLNGPTQLRLRQAVSQSTKEIAYIEQLANEWFKYAPANGFTGINRASIALSKQVPGRMGAVARTLEGQIDIFTGEYANVLMGGGVPTDHALELAQSVFSKEMNPEMMRMAFEAVHQNLAMRKFSILEAGPANVNSESPYRLPDRDESGELIDNEVEEGQEQGQPAQTPKALRPGERPPLDSFYRKK